MAKKKKGAQKVTPKSNQTPKKRPNLSKAVKVNRLMSPYPSAQSLSNANPYLATLLDPENHEFYYPDKNSSDVALCRFKEVDVIPIDSNGEFWLWFNPTLPDVVVVKASESAATRTYVGGINFPKSWAVPTAFADCVLVPDLSTAQITGPESPPARTLMNNSGVYTIPALSANGSGYIKWTNTDISCQVVWEDGSTTAVTSGVAFTVASTHSTMKIQFKSSSGATAPMAGFDLSLVLPEAAGFDDFAPDPVDSFDDLVGTQTVEPVFSSYRTIGASLLISYQGDLLTNAGSIAAVPVPAGETPWKLGYTSYDSIAQLRNSFEGPARTGTYMYWKPTDEVQMAFRVPSTSNANGAYPSFVVCGKGLHTDGTSVLRYKACLVVEAQTPKPYMSPLPGVVLPELITLADKALRGQAQIMENPLHLEKVKETLKNAFAKGAALASTVGEIATAVGPVASALASLLI